MTDRIWTCAATGGVRFDPPPDNQPGWVEWAPVDARTCPLGEGCDLTVAWMAGQAEAKASLSDRIAELKTQVGFARIDADQQRARAEAAEAALEAAEAAPDDVAELLERAELAGNEMEDEGHHNHAQVLNEAAAIVNAQWREACRLHWRLETAHCALRSVEKDELAARERAEALEAALEAERAKADCGYKEVENTRAVLGAEMERLAQQAADDAATAYRATERAEAAEAEIARLKQRILDDTEEIRDMTQDHMDTIKAQLEIERQLSARAEAAEAGLARLRDAIVYATTELAQSAQDMPAMRAERRLIAAIRGLARQHPAPGDQGGKGGGNG
jgi:chromosome segregation ATPase